MKFYIFFTIISDSYFNNKYNMKKSGVRLKFFSLCKKVNVFSSL
jgi:hypothetical protein